MIEKEIKRDLTEKIADLSFNACLGLKMEAGAAKPVYVNKAFERMFAVTKEELCSRTLQETMLLKYGKEGADNLEKVLEKIIGSEESVLESYYDVQRCMYLRVMGFVPMEGYICLMLMDMTGYERSREKVEAMHEQIVASESQYRYQKDLLNATQNSLDETKRVYKMISENATDGFVYYNYQTGEVFASKKWFTLFPVAEEMVGNRDEVMASIDEEYRLEYVERWKTAVAQKKATESFSFQLDKSGAWISQISHFWYDDSGNLKEAVSFYQDNTYEMLQRRELEMLAYYDSFTGVYNRNYFIQWLNEQIMFSKKDMSVVQLLYVDIDRFKWINDRLGTQIADEVLLKIATMLKTFESETIKVARLSNDEFVLGLNQRHANDSALRIAEEISEKLKTPILLSSGMKYYITVSMGLAECNEDIQTAADLVRAADLAMIQSKKAGRNKMTHYESHMGVGFVGTAVLEQKLQSVADQEGFYLLYQPQYQTETKKLRGVEALIRWHDDELGDISPAQFIPVAEQNGTIHKIGDFVIRQALKTLSRWQREFGYDGMMSINISAVQFQEGKFIDTLQYYTGLYELDAQKIEVELTESVFIENFEDTVKLIKKLRDLGYKVSLDDFGTGYSSLSYLRIVPFDTLKIDRSFITELSKEKNATIITNSIIEMAEKLGLEVIAEGVEEQQQFDSLAKNRCSIIQGYLMGRPLMQEKVEELMQQ
ncbi:MAG: bifunctional diguanylate cyclase/phosphodiesterase [Lachnospiraceae bacterium]|nr:bifunctional diguanylate cyclase/phosphodiesterase [Lachnospiraceae bacterium]